MCCENHFGVRAVRLLRPDAGPALVACRLSWLIASAVADHAHRLRRQIEHLVAALADEVSNCDADDALGIRGGARRRRLAPAASSRMPAADTRAAGGTASWLTIPASTLMQSSVC